LIDLVELDWDSKFFGFSVAKITYNSKNTDIYELPLKYKLFYLFCDCYLKLDHIKRIFCKTDVILVDEKITFNKRLEKQLNFKIEKNIQLQNENDSKLYELAFQSGIYSRFLVDENIGKNKFKKMYKLWIDNSLKNENIDVLVYKSKIDIEGFLTFDYTSDIAKIGLIAVSEKSRGNKIGTKLIEHVEYLSFKKEIKDLQVTTQRKNVGACKFYEKFGFKEVNKKYIYHIWQQ